VGKDVHGIVAPGSLDRDANDRFNTHQSTSLGGGRKRREQNQAIGRSRGGRNTKIHTIADAKGRLLSLLLTDGAAHDCPTAQPLISLGRVAKRLLGDKAYDSAELRQWLRARGTASVIPNRSNRNGIMLKMPFVG
jgi:IS5 family transposase